MEPNRLEQETLGELEVKTHEVIRVFERACELESELHCEVGQRSDVAFIKVFSNGPETRWAAASSPGDRWASLDLDGGFSVDHFEEDMPEATLLKLLQSYIHVAKFYVCSDVKEERRGLFRQRVKVLDLDGQVLVFRRPLMGG